MLACGTVVPSFLLLRHRTENTSSSAQASSSGPTSDFVLRKREGSPNSKPAWHCLLINRTGRGENKDHQK